MKTILCWYFQDMKQAWSIIIYHHLLPVFTWNTHMHAYSTSLLWVRHSPLQLMRNRAHTCHRHCLPTQTRPQTPTTAPSNWCLSPFPAVYKERNALSILLAATMKPTVSICCMLSLLLLITAGKNCLSWFSIKCCCFGAGIKVDSKVNQCAILFKYLHV